jgi:hypothetical protein
MRSVSPRRGNTRLITRIAHRDTNCRRSDGIPKIKARTMSAPVTISKLSGEAIPLSRQPSRHTPAAPIQASRP